MVGRAGVEFFPSVGEQFVEFGERWQIDKSV
jgi:hypothetical protein